MSYSYNRIAAGTDLATEVKKIGWRAENAVSVVEAIQRRLAKGGPDSDIQLQLKGLEEELQMAMKFLDQAKKLVKK